MLIEFEGIKPEIGKRSWVAENATVLGEVLVGEDCSIWFGAILRADIHYIHIGNRTNIQDLSMIHVTHYTKPDKSDGFPVEIGNDVTVGHKVMIHGAKIGNGCLIGMNATLLDGCEVGEESIVGAGALLTQNKKYPPRSLILGSPAKVIRELTGKEVEGLYEHAAHYAKYKDRYLNEDSSS